MAKKKRRKTKNKTFYNKPTQVKSATVLNTKKDNPKMTFIARKSQNFIASWLSVNDWNSNREKYLLDILQTFDTKPLISIIMPVYNIEPIYIIEAIQSIEKQVYENWELCIVDDGSTNEDTLNILEEYKNNNKIKIQHRVNGGISEATNTAVSIASGEYLAFVDNDDLLTEDALAEIIICINKHKDAKIIYTDDDKITQDGNRKDFQFKPDWSPELLLSYMYFGHLLVVSKNLYNKAGGMRKEFDGSQDYDFVLRATELTDSIYHIPKLVYHWKVVPGSTAENASCKPASFLAGEKAIKEALIRRKINADVTRPKWAVDWNCGYYELVFPDEGPEVTIIIPTKNKYEILKKCIDSITTKTTYKNYNILVVDNESDEKDSINYLESIPHTVLTVKSPEKFNFSYINNKAVESVTTDYILLLNNDTAVIDPRWLSQMMGYIQFDGVGSVGARLLFPNGLIQHAGLVHGFMDGGVAPSFKMMKSNSGTYLAFERISRNCSSVTAACLLTKKNLYLEVGGLDEESFPIGYNDPDYGNRLAEKGYRSVYCASARLFHYESISRGKRPADDILDFFRYRNKYKHFKDPYYNDNLSLDSQQYLISSVSVSTHKLINPIKTLMLSYNFNLEGSSYSQYEMTIGLVKRGIIDPIVYSFQKGPLMDLYKKNGIKVIVFPSPLSGSFNIDNYYKGLQILKTYIIQNNIELVYANTLQMFYGIDAAKELDIPSIWNVRESEPIDSYFTHFGIDIARRALNCFYYPYKIVFVSHVTRQGCRILAANQNFTTIHNALNIERMGNIDELKNKKKSRRALGISHNKIIFLSLGTVCGRKNQLELLRAIHLLPQQFLDLVEFYIVGDRPETAYSKIIHKFVDVLPEKKQKIIKIIPETKDVGLYYGASDVFVLNTKMESYPRVILEAMLFDLPIITTPTKGIVEQVFNNVNGVHYPLGDIKRLTNLIMQFTIDKDLRIRMKKNTQIMRDGMSTYNEMLYKYEKVFTQAWLSGRSR